MRIDHYAGAAFLEVAWYVAQLRAENPLLLRRTAVWIGRTGFLDLLDRRETEIGGLMTLAAPQRAAAFARLEVSERQALLLAACYRARIAESYLRAGSERGVDASIDIHPLTMMFRAEEAAILLRDDFPSLWPFQDSDPFGEGLD